MNFPPVSHLPDGLFVDPARSLSAFPPPLPHSYLEWETFRIIYRELFQGLGLCLMAVLVLTLILIAHPGAAALVFLCVTMTIVDVLGVM